MLEKICKAELSDLQDIAALESEIFSDAWSLKSLEETWNQKNAVIFAAKTEEKIAGYLIIYYVLDEGEIEGSQQLLLCADKGLPDKCSRNLWRFVRNSR